MAAGRRVATGRSLKPKNARGTVLAEKSRKLKKP
jgi:hypothetical protein